MGDSMTPPNMEECIDLIFVDLKGLFSIGLYIYGSNLWKIP